MLTDANAGVDGLWLAVSELARRKGVSKQAVSKRVARMCEQGLIQTRTGERGAVLVNLVEFDRIAGETTDMARAQGGTKPQVPRDQEDGAPQTFTQAQADEKRYKAEMARLDLEERLKKLLPVEDVQAAMVRVAEVLIRDIERLPARTDDPALRKILRTFASDARERMAQSMTMLFEEGRADEVDARKNSGGRSLALMDADD